MTLGQVLQAVGNGVELFGFHIGGIIAKSKNMIIPQLTSAYDGDAARVHNSGRIHATPVAIGSLVALN